MICWFGNSSNDISSNKMFVYLKSSVSSRLSGIPIQESNFRDSISLFIARRKLIKDTFIIHEDVYLAPNSKDTLK